MPGSDVDSGKEPANRIRQVRKDLGLRVRDLIERTGYTEDQIYNTETGRTEPNTLDLLRYAEAMGVTAGALLPRPTSEIETLGEIIDGRVVPAGSRAPTTGEEALGVILECPPDLDPAAIAALIVSDSSMLPLEIGTVLFVERPRAWDRARYIGRFCIVRPKEGEPWLLGSVRPGPGLRINILAPWRAPVEGLEISDAARVVAIVPPPYFVQEDEAQYPDALAPASPTLHENVAPFRPRRPRRS